MILSVVDSLVSARTSVKALVLAKKGDLRAIQKLVLASSFPTLFLGAHNLSFPWIYVWTPLGISHCRVGFNALHEHPKWL